MTKLEVLERIRDDLELLYNNAEDKGERGAVSYVEDIVDNWLNAELKVKEHQR